MLGKENKYMKKKYIRPLSYTTYKNTLKMDYRLKYKNRNNNVGSQLFDIGFSNIFLICLLEQRQQKQK